MSGMPTREQGVDNRQKSEDEEFLDLRQPVRGNVRCEEGNDRKPEEGKQRGLDRRKA